MGGPFGSHSSWSWDLWTKKIRLFHLHSIFNGETEDRVKILTVDSLIQKGEGTVGCEDNLAVTSLTLLIARVDSAHLFCPWKWLSNPLFPVAPASIVWTFVSERNGLCLQLSSFLNPLPTYRRSGSQSLFILNCLRPFPSELVQDFYIWPLSGNSVTQTGFTLCPYSHIHILFETELSLFWSACQGAAGYNL